MVSIRRYVFFGKLYIIFGCAAKGFAAKSQRHQEILIAGLLAGKRGCRELQIFLVQALSTVNCFRARAGDCTLR